ncbi:Transposon Tn7 transposition protein tnsB [Serratia fonticola]|uniref:DDE-type integrase/transposase/recombinase n=1 Tax=Serratia fonticola TaxID=47917 RepID=UPI0021830959|nr:DDE-type integrase/transposase/recombinase [Serratia fonticola]CAI2051443.1 Transposon Tn7 transposition protein tnsB [Serratia fonticola]
MWETNEVLRFNENLYRILMVKPGEIVWIKLDDPKSVPEYVLELQLLAWLDDERLFRHQDPYAHIHDQNPEYGSVAYLKRDNNLKIIQLIIIDERCFDTKVRAERVRQVEMAGLASKATIYKILRRFWQRGQKPNSLLPDYKNSGKRGYSRSNSGSTKLGRARKYGEGEGIKVTVEIEKLFRRTIEKYLMSQNSLQITTAYRRFLDLFVQYYPDVLPENRPTLRQFRYFYDREYKKPQRLVSQTHPNIYKKDIRPLISTATAQVMGPGSRYEIDATIADIYLVADDDSNKIVGRPTIYIVIDVFSRMVTGFYIGLDNPSYTVAMQAIVNACSDKVGICQRYDIDITLDEWPCAGLPDAILADRGEMMSHQVENMISGFNLRVESAPPRRGDAKGIVESCFRTLQAEFKPYAPGVVTGNRVKKHGERDYRLDAAITVSDFTQVILRTILFRNNHHVMEKYDRDADLPTAIPSIPLELWNWGMQHRVGSLRKVDTEQLRIALLPRKKSSFSVFGVNVWGLYYTSAEIMREGWLQRSTEIKRPQSLQTAYDPTCADTIYLFPQADSRIYWTCSLTDRSRQFRGMTFWQVWDIQSEEKHSKANAKISEDEKRRELDAFLKEKLASAVKTLPEDTQSNREKISRIRQNKQQALNEERLQRNLSISEDLSKKTAEVILIKPDDEDYRFPAFVPSLFDDKQEEDE